MTSRFLARSTSAALIAISSATAWALQDHGGHDGSPAQEKAAKQEWAGDPYLLATDPVSGKGLGPASRQVVLSHEGRELRFASQENADAFKADPKKYLSAIDEKLIHEQAPRYPLETCVVSGDKLGAKGAGFSFVYRNRLVRLSSKEHLATFHRDSARFMAKLDQAVIATQKSSYAASTCVVSGEKLGGKMGPPVDHVVGNQLVRFCCKDCLKNFNNEPLEYMGKLTAGGKAGRAKGGSDKAASYTCPMHPDVVKDKPGRCPKCGMGLVKKK